MDGTLTLRKIIIRLRIGAYPFERITSRNIPVDLQWSDDIPSGSKIDYTEVAALLSEFNNKEYLYIEELAEDILSRLLKEFRGKWSVTVTKPFPPGSPMMESASYTVKG